MDKNQFIVHENVNVENLPKQQTIGAIQDTSSEAHQVIDFTDIEALKQLADYITSIRNKPEDEYEIAALLESTGWSDARVKETYGFANVFEMAKTLWRIIRKKRTFNLFTPMTKIRLNEYPLMFFRYFMKGTIFALPMAISVFAMLTIRFSLWSYESYNVEIATSIAIGTILSFLCIGGFTQAIAKQGYGYIRQGYYDMARKATFYFVRLGWILSILVVAVLLMGNFVFGIFPFRMLFLIISYYFILDVIWLSVTIMYVLEKELIFSGLLVLGIFVIYILFRILKMDIILSQLIAMSGVAILGATVAFGIFKRLERKQDHVGIKPELPRKTVILNSVGQYFLYGFSYFAFLFTDRLISWSTDDIYMPFIIWFRGEYELGLDFALLMLIIPMGFVEFIVNEMMVGLLGTQQDYFSYEVDKMYKRYLKIYAKRAVLILVITILSCLLIHRVVMLLGNNRFAFINIHISDITYYVFIVAMIGYGFTAISLLNAELLFCLIQPKLANKCIVPALLTNMFVGFILSRWFGHQYAVWGLLVGSLVFLIMSSQKVIKVLKNLDYYLYGAT
ncbi:MAG TPA: hypothetical protein DDZ89_11325 [Clostridiales bacterium]|nr:hypothetical protein [Clostridiales bacterium]